MKQLGRVYSKLRIFFDPSIEGNPFKTHAERKKYITIGMRYKKVLVIGN